MPKVSKKQKLLEGIYEVGLIEIMNCESDEDISEIIEDVKLSITLAETCPFGEILNVPKQTEWLENVLPSYDEGRFKHALRVSHENFDRILHSIQNHPIFFHPQGLQLPVSIQLAVTLYRFGNSSTAASARNIAMLFGIGDGSTVCRITRRVQTAILSLKTKIITWPNEDERSLIMAEMDNVLSGVILWVDGTHIKLEQAPVLDKESYFDKNKNYSIQVQIICDQWRNIRHYVCGYPGSVHDSRVWNESEIKNSPERYLSAGQKIGADKGYPLSSITITPYRENPVEAPKTKLRKFNKYFSKLRVVTEHVNGILKEIFGSLKELRVLIKDSDSHRDATEWIECCMILYNLILPTLDKATLEMYEMVSSIEQDDNNNVANDHESDDGKQCRYALLECVNANI